MSITERVLKEPPVLVELKVHAANGEYATFKCNMKTEGRTIGELLAALEKCIGAGTR